MCNLIIDQVLHSILSQLQVRDTQVIIYSCNDQSNNVIIISMSMHAVYIRKMQVCKSSQAVDMANLDDTISYILIGVNCDILHSVCFTGWHATNDTSPSSLIKIKNDRLQTW